MAKATGSGVSLGGHHRQDSPMADEMFDGQVHTLFIKPCVTCMIIIDNNLIHKEWPRFHKTNNKTLKLSYLSIEKK